MKTVIYFFGILTTVCVSCTLAIAQQFAIEAEKQNTMVIGVPNPIKAIVQGYPCKDIVVKTSNGRVESNGDCTCNVVPMEIGKAVIQLVTRKGNKLLAEKDFRVTRLTPYPVAKVAGCRNRSIPLRILREQLGLAVIIENLGIEPQVKITGYFMTLITTLGDCKSFAPATDAYFTAEMKAVLSKVSSGDRLIFTSIMALGPSGIPLQLDPMELKVQ
jgi:hypothetical protein